MSNRRDFFRKALAGAAFAGISGAGLAIGANPKDDNAMLTGSQLKTKPASALGLRDKPMNKVRIGFIGLGHRGSEAVRRYLFIEGVEIVALCDKVPERVKEAQAKLIERGVKPAAEYSNGPDDWENVCKRDDIDLIYACTPWEMHTPNAIFAMKHGKHVAVEVPISFSIADCWRIVETAEETQRHCMMLENCCYDFFELATLNMARQGLLGEVIHAECAYIHNLNGLIFSNFYQDRWRLKYNQAHTGNLYPTHGLGPVCQIMDINRGDSFDYLTSNSTNQFGSLPYAAKALGVDSDVAKAPYKRGDMNTTLIRTKKGHTIMVQHDVTSPRPYDRIHKISGTKGFAVKYPTPMLAIEPNPEVFLKPKELKKALFKYQHPLEKQIGTMAKKVGGHGGMDFMMDYRLIYCLRNGLPLDQNVYDGVTWSGIIELSERSAMNGSIPVQIPDFTRGAWTTTPQFEMAL